MAGRALLRGPRDWLAGWLLGRKKIGGKKEKEKGRGCPRAPSRGGHCHGPQGPNAELFKAGFDAAIHACGAFPLFGGGG